MDTRSTGAVSPRNAPCGYAPQGLDSADAAPAPIPLSRPHEPESARRSTPSSLPTSCGTDVRSDRPGNPPCFSDILAAAAPAPARNDFCRRQTGRRQRSTKRHRLVGTLKQCGTMDAQARASGVALAVDASAPFGLARRFPALQADRAQPLSNAVKYTPAVARLLSAGIEPGGCCLCQCAIRHRHEARRLRARGTLRPARALPPRGDRGTGLGPALVRTLRCPWRTLALDTNGPGHHRFVRLPASASHPPP